MVGHYYNFAIPGDGQIYTTIEDLTRWDQAFYTHEVLGEDVVRALHTQGVLNSGEAIDYAFGLVVTEYKGIEAVRHGGSWGGFRAALLRFPEERLSVLCLCNLGSINASSQAEKVAEIYLADRFVDESEQEQVAASEDKSVAISTEALRAFEGAFRSLETGDVWRFELSDGALQFTSFARGRLYKLTPAGQRSFRLAEPARDMRIDFVSTQDGQIELRVTEPGTEQEFYPLGLESPDGEALSSYVGDYVSDELDVTYHIRRSGDCLTLERGLSDEARELTPATRELFFARSWALDFRRDASGEIVGFLLGAGRVKNVDFRRLER